MDPEPLEEFLTQFLLYNAPPYVVALCCVGSGRRMLTAIFYPLLFIPLSVLGGLLLAGVVKSMPAAWQVRHYALGWVVLISPFMFAHGVLCTVAYFAPPTARREQNGEVAP